MSNGFSVGAERVCLIWTAVVKNLPHNSSRRAKNVMDSSTRWDRRTQGVRRLSTRPDVSYFFTRLINCCKSNKCCGLYVFFDHLDSGSNSTPTKYPISR